MTKMYRVELAAMVTETVMVEADSPEEAERLAPAATRAQRFNYVPRLAWQTVCPSVIIDTITTT